MLKKQCLALLALLVVPALAHAQRIDLPMNPANIIRTMPIQSISGNIDHANIFDRVGNQIGVIDCATPPADFRFVSGVSMNGISFTNEFRFESTQKCEQTILAISTNLDLHPVMVLSIAQQAIFRIRPSHCSGETDDGSLDQRADIDQPGFWDRYRQERH